VVGARANGGDDLLGLGGCKDELDVGWWFFNDFEQGVKAGCRNHVRLVEDKDFVAVARRCECRPFAKIASVVNSVVAGRIDFYNV